MGRLTLLLDKDKKERLTVPVYLTEDKVKEVDNFLTDNKKDSNQNRFESFYCRRPESNRFT